MQHSHSPPPNQTQMVTTVFTGAYHMSLPYANTVHSLPSYCLMTHFNSILHLQLGLSSGLFPSGFTIKSWCTFLFAPKRATSSIHHILIDMITHDLLTLTPWCRVLLEKLTGLQLVKKFPSFLCNPKVHYRTHKRPLPVPVLGQPNPVHIPTSHLLEIHPNIIHPSTPGSPQ